MTPWELGKDSHRYRMRRTIGEGLGNPTFQEWQRKQILTLRKETAGKLAELGAGREVGFTKMWKKGHLWEDRVV